MTLLNVMGLDLPILIVIAVIVLLFSGNKLAGVGKGAGRAIREFRDETHATTPITNPFGEEPPVSGAPSGEAAPAVAPTEASATTPSTAAATKN